MSDYIVRKLTMGRIVAIIVLSISLQFNAMTYAQIGHKVYTNAEVPWLSFIIEGENEVVFQTDDTLTMNLFASGEIPMDSLRKFIPGMEPVEDFKIWSDTIQFPDSEMRNWKGYIFEIPISRILFEDEHLRLVEFIISIDEKASMLMRSISIKEEASHKSGPQEFQNEKWTLLRIVHLSTKVDL